ncbi:Cu(I)/Ag(I) efflux system membrane protein CusA/SilA [Rheinheimera pacifica]|uniref:Cu(I)/Ag(I) efflux system membrane protein CusA/SilA n=1 Tax=Rheinheimera pacifica TaxID=173990 RepID=A0A1H6LHK4_9GAMM|nr:CusA/CzcA family heavy metal efflux RND transporter [Rheinheimera pacifica]SEH84797.1 Cu(I)/Ag(I) efflux system membrane protein CusA/SilA [Rheinheimera pacifica]
MIKAIIRWSVQNPLLILLSTFALALFGYQASQQLKLDALPDLSDVQVIIKTNYPGQTPETIEQQISYPLSSALLAVPKAKAVRSFSMPNDSYLYVIFEDGTDPYWARSRVLEYLQTVTLPAGANATLGPDASGVGWIFQYALVDRTGQQSLEQLSSLQQFFLKPELQSVGGVAEVASIGGMAKTYQLQIEPRLMRAYNVTLAQVISAINNHNQQQGGGIIEVAETELLVQAGEYIQSLENLAAVPLGVRNSADYPLTLADVGTVQLVPAARRGIAELNGEGEVIGGIIVMRQGENALSTINAVKHKLAGLKNGLPEGVELVTVYDRSELIENTVSNLSQKLLEEMAVVALVCLVFLLHARSALVAVISLPLALLASILLMQKLGINANVMSLGGIAIAIGALVDAAIVMVEHGHKKLEQARANGKELSAAEFRQTIIDACLDVGPALFFSLLVITVSFLPVFMLEAQEGRLFAPLAYTKTFAMASAALLAITLIPVLMLYFLRGKLPSEHSNPLSRLLIALYTPLLTLCLRFPKALVLLCLLALGSSLLPWQRLSTEFMPAFAEGDLLYMPTTLPGISPATAAKLLQQTDRLIKTVPEVDTVLGKSGRADTATDPAPLTMLETSIKLKPQSQWRHGVTLNDIIAQLDATVQVPGLTNAWLPPIKTRIDMLSTGIRTAVGVRVSGPDLATISQTAQQLESQIRQLPGSRSVFAERAEDGLYLQITPDLQQLGRYGLTLAELQQYVAFAIGGAPVAQSIQGRERYDISLRFPRDSRSHPDDIRRLPLQTADGAYLLLEQVAKVEVIQGPVMIRAENARLTSWVYIDLPAETRLGTYIAQLQQLLAEQRFAPQVSVSIGGQYEYLQRVTQRLQQLLPFTLLLIVLLLYLTFRRFSDVLLVLVTLPFALSGSLWLLYLLDYQLSVAVAVGLIALGGVAAEFAVVMLLYLKRAVEEVKPQNQQQLWQAIMQGAVQRVRPKAMTVLTIIVSLLPVMLGSGAGNEVMQRIAAPMLGGMLAAPLVSMLLMPVLYFLLLRRALPEK